MKLPRLLGLLAVPALMASLSLPAKAELLEPALSNLERRWDIGGAAGLQDYIPGAYKPVYLMPLTHSDRLNRRPSSPSDGRTATTDQELRHIEAKYQLSFKSRLHADLAGSGVSLWAAYTQSSRWQVYNGAISRPFRETNYEPEIIALLPVKLPLAGGHVRTLSLSLNHQSNGRSLPLSRSWNRWIAGVAWERGDWIVELRPWARLREAAADDDNPDILDHVGRGELLIGRYTDRHAFTLQLRHTLRGSGRSRGSAQVEWAFPIDGAMRGWLQVFSGHGESLVDYNLRQNKIGVGIAIAGWR
jgi:phospholipase A1/A2